MSATNSVRKKNVLIPSSDSRRVRIWQCLESHSAGATSLKAVCFLLLCHSSVFHIPQLFVFIFSFVCRARHVARKKRRGKWFLDNRRWKSHADGIAFDSAVMRLSLHRLSAQRLLTSTCRVRVLAYIAHSRAQAQKFKAKKQIILHCSCRLAHATLAHSHTHTFRANWAH